jgi:quercetin dioxygenase-like cupin family protein
MLALELDVLLSAIATQHRMENRAEADATAHALLTTQVPQALTSRLPCPLDDEIRAVLATSDHPLARALLAAQGRMPWGTNPVEGTPGVSSTIFSVATLMGPEGPVPSPDFRMGFFFQRPDTYYPLHNHDADETYVILAGSAIWTAGSDTRERGPGDIIHHPSLMPHAFRTGPEGIVAMWRWSGDINTRSYAFLLDPQISVA